MNKLSSIILLFSILSCNSNLRDEKTANKHENETLKVGEGKETPIIGERIDGPANIRNKPNGDILFELYDDALVELSTKPENDWYEVLVYADIDFGEFPLDSILKDRPIIVNKDTIGRVIKSHSVSSSRGGDYANAMLYGYTHKNNIKPETVIETTFIKNLKKSGRDLSAWKWFIEAFKLENDAVGYESFQSYYNYENSIEDPSPGFRIVLLFENQNLVGLIHSRKLQIESTKAHKLDWSYSITFFDDYPEKGQLKFVEFMKEWIQGVD